MFSKPVAGNRSDGSWPNGSNLRSFTRHAVQQLSSRLESATEDAQRLMATSADCAGFRLHKPIQARRVAIRTTVHENRDSAASRRPGTIPSAASRHNPSRSRPKVDGISTTVAESRCGCPPTCINKVRLDPENEVLRTGVPETPLLLDGFSSRIGVDAKKDPDRADASKPLELAKAVVETVGSPMLLTLPLQVLLSGTAFSGVASGICLSANVPCVNPPPAWAATQQRLQALGEEEEQFAALIFPGFKADSFIWQMTCWQVAEFAISMCLGHNKASPLPCVLYRLGASWGPAVSQGALWRLLAPVTLHANLTHLLFNVFFQLRMGFGMEKQFGKDKMMLLYFACGIIGNLISVSVDPFKLAVGASTAGFGLIGVWLAEIFLSWELLGPARERTMIWVVFMLVSVTTMSSMTPNMDLYGHLGGAIGGFLLSVIISDMREEDRPPWYSQARVAATICLAALVTGCGAKVLAFSPREPLPNCPALYQVLGGPLGLGTMAQS